MLSLNSKKRAKSSTNKPFNFNTNLKASKSVINTKPYQVSIFFFIIRLFVFFGGGMTLALLNINEKEKEAYGISLMNLLSVRFGS